MPMRPARRAGPSSRTAGRCREPGSARRAVRAAGCSSPGPCGHRRGRPAAASPSSPPARPSRTTSTRWPPCNRDTRRRAASQILSPPTSALCCRQSSTSPRPRKYQPLPTMPCSLGSAPVSSVACTEQVTAGSTGLSSACQPPSRARAASRGMCASSRGVSPATSRTTSDRRGHRTSAAACCTAAQACQARAGALRPGRARAARPGEAQLRGDAPGQFRRAGRALRHRAARSRCRSPRRSGRSARVPPPTRTASADRSTSHGGPQRRLRGGVQRHVVVHPPRAGQPGIQRLGQVIRGLAGGAAHLVQEAGARRSRVARPPCPAPPAGPRPAPRTPAP